ncbi:FAD-dependent oxidoreductase [Aspergillus homomorphus CBS 101889]|uniref:FAD/NAD(P)-binding domain-containing protein n=1 Tax=Aspergillus homomorphus (strain CBS 101889) TaxID=1450537 RepID=A0A395HJX1_ASPHC|nr:FAD/NAD(P)-binding domain-containing protein [Aspergillus homomorphus CBS 101889]RAL07228.1 FAD/NAD(P)-binding domain-containing protein [Aspergillus homomorphus CBS 101889]
MGIVQWLWALLGAKPREVTAPERKLNATVLIVGAGSTGLALAQGLKQAGISCVVLEKHTCIGAHTRDWNMGLHWGAESLRSLIPDELWKRIQSVQVDPSISPTESDALNFIHGSTGEIMASIPAPMFNRLRRRKLRELLATGLDLRYDKRLQAVDFSEDGQDVTARLADGSCLTTKIIIGADGARSTVRQLLLPETGQIRQLPYCATFVQARFSAEQARFLRQFHPLYLAGINPAGLFAFFGMHDVENPGRPETWTFFFYISWHSDYQEQERTAGWSNAQRLKQVKEYAKNFANPWKSAFKWLDDDHEVWYMGLTDFDPGAEDHHWDNQGGRVTLAGDAAHAMTYQRGQGLNHSITDAAKLVEAIRRFVSGEELQSTAVSEYEEEMIARASDEVRLSTVNTEMVHNWQQVKQSPVLASGMKKHSSDALL